MNKLLQMFNRVKKVIFKKINDIKINSLISIFVKIIIIIIINV
jgi:hypothetical protein